MVCSGLLMGLSGRSILKYVRSRFRELNLLSSADAAYATIGCVRIEARYAGTTLREKSVMFDNLLKPEHLIIILVIALLIFGPSKLPGLGKGLGEAFRGFKEGIKGTPDNPDAAKQQENTAAKSENATTQVK